MPRCLRVEYKGAGYHVMCRGNRGVRVFETDEDVALWLETLGEACERSQLMVHAYCLMSTHYHLLLETPEGNLVEGMKWLQGTFTQRYNARHKSWGHLFQGRYKAKIVDEDSDYFRTAGMYILLNPVDAGLVDLQKADLSSYCWSSYPAQIGAPSKRPDWLQVDRLLRSCGFDGDSIANRRAFAAYLKARGLEIQLNALGREDEKRWRMMERGWVHGGTEFRQAMIDLLESQSKDVGRRVLPGEQKRDVSQAAAEKALELGLGRFKLSADDLKRLPKGDPRKLLLAGWLRTRFQVSATWIAEAVALGHPSTSTRALNFYRDPPSEWHTSKQILDKFFDY